MNLSGNSGHHGEVGEYLERRLFGGLVQRTIIFDTVFFAIKDYKSDDWRVTDKDILKVVQGENSVEKTA